HFSVDVTVPSGPHTSSTSFEQLTEFAVQSFASGAMFASMSEPAHGNSHVWPMLSLSCSPVRSHLVRPGTSTHSASASQWSGSRSRHPAPTPPSISRNAATEPVSTSRNQLLKFMEISQTRRDDLVAFSWGH